MPLIYLRLPPLYLYLLSPSIFLFLERPHRPRQKQAYQIKQLLNLKTRAHALLHASRSKNESACYKLLHIILAHPKHVTATKRTIRSSSQSRIITATTPYPFFPPFLPPSLPPSLPPFPPLNLYIFFPPILHSLSTLPFSLLLFCSNHIFPCDFLILPLLLFNTPFSLLLLLLLLLLPSLLLPSIHHRRRRWRRRPPLARNRQLAPRKEKFHLRRRKGRHPLPFKHSTNATPLRLLRRSSNSSSSSNSRFREFLVVVITSVDKIRPSSKISSSLTCLLLLLLLLL